MRGEKGGQGREGWEGMRDDDFLLRDDQIHHDDHHDYDTSYEVVALSVCRSQHQAKLSQSRTRRKEGRAL